LHSKDGSENTADAAGGIQRSLGGSVEVAEDGVVEEDGADTGAGIDGDCANRNLPAPGLDDPEQNGKDYEIEQMGFEADRDQACTGEQVAGERGPGRRSILPASAE
jgi:hypothetical protein